MFNLILSNKVTPDSEYGFIFSGIDTEQLFTFLFVVMLIIYLLLLGYILYLKYKISKLEFNNTNNTKEGTSNS